MDTFSAAVSAVECDAAMAVPGAVRRDAVDAEMLYFEDLEVGDSWTSRPRRITADDVSQFAELTGDHTSLHDDERPSPFGKPIAHGLLGLSILAGLSSMRPQVATLALSQLEDWRFEAPIFFGDTVHVRTEVVQSESHGRRAGRIVWHRQLINQDGRVVQSGRIVTIVSSRARSGGSVRPR